jgi:hypothetical protein
MTTSILFHLSLEIIDREMFDKTLDYIYLNALMAGFVIKPEDWKYSSVRDFCEIDSIQIKGQLNFVVVSIP